MLELEEKIKDEFSGKEERLSGTVSIGMAEASSANIVADVIGQSIYGVAHYSRCETRFQRQ